MTRKKPPRRPVPPDVEKQVLTKSLRRCALCFHLDRDTRQKKGQIAHLDRRRSNNIEDNLAWLCFDHHSEYDSSTSQHKNYTIEEVKHARDALYRWVKRGMPPLPSRKSVKRQSPNKNPIKNMSGGPEIVIEYIYAENSQTNHDANRPLVVRNNSITSAAYNVEVLPLETDHGLAKFEPGLIPHIEPGGSKNVFADIKNGSPLFSRRLPELLIKSYAHESVQELFGIMTFALRVRYQGVDSTIFETECELLFRPWKKRTNIGRIKRKVIPVKVSKADLTESPAAPHPQLPERRPRVTPTLYGLSAPGGEGLHLSNEGTPAYELYIDPITLTDGWTLSFEPLNRLAENGFSRTSISKGQTHTTPLDGIWPNLSLSGTPPILPLVIHYRDFGGHWYQSVCELHRDVLKKSGFDVKFIRQE